MNVIVQQTYKRYFSQDGWVPKRRDEVVIEDEGDEFTRAPNEYVEGARTSARHSRGIAVGIRDALNPRVVVLNLVSHEQFIERRLADADISNTFNQLMAEWKDATRFISSSTSIVLHPAYQRIIGLGPPVIRFILRDLESNGGHWHFALKALTGEDPTRPEDAGRIRAIKGAWLDWGRRNGFI